MMPTRKADLAEVKTFQISFSPPVYSVNMEPRELNEQQVKVEQGV